MEPDISNESKDEDTDSLTQVFISPLNFSPALDFGPSTSSSQTLFSEHSTRNPNSQTGLLSPLPTKAIQNPQIAQYLPNKDANTYELEKFNENRMIIFNHDQFISGPSRPGTMKDENLLRETFEKFRFKIDPTFKNLEMKPLLEIVTNFALRTNFSAYGCVCVAILTHGYKEPGFLKAYDRRYSEYDIFKHFDASKNPTLAAKPIIFIIQSCRGPQPAPKVNAGGNKPAPQLDYGEELENYHLPTEADRIVFHSSYVGKASVRDPENGSWFIQTLCKKINEYALTHDLEAIFRLVRRAVAMDYDTKEDWKQMPVVTSTTLRELYLASNDKLRTEMQNFTIDANHRKIDEYHEKTLVLHGLPENYGETEMDVMDRITNIFYDSLNIDLSGYIEEITFIGKQGRVRPIKIELISKRAKKYILENSAHIKEAGLGVTEYLNLTIE